MKGNGYARMLWAARELWVHPKTSLGMALVLALLTTMVAAGLLLSQALTATISSLLDQGPDLVVRRVGPAGWQPMQEKDAALALAVPGIIEARPRIWGTVGTREKAVTVMAADAATIARLMAPDVLPPLAPGQAIAGRGVSIEASSASLTLQGATDLAVHVVRRFPSRSDMATHEVVLLHPGDVRRLLGLASNQASDLALHVFHPEEAEALRPDLARAFPWPVHVATRQETRKYYAAAFGRRGALGSMLYLPAALALMLLVAVVVRQQIGDRRRMGLLKALGWTSRDILALQMTKASLVSLPAIATGLAAAYGLVYAPSQSWIGRYLLGWQKTAPLLHLDVGYAAPVFLEVTGMLLVPFGAAVLWSSLRLAAATPQDLLDRGN